MLMSVLMTLMTATLTLTARTTLEAFHACAAVAILVMEWKIAQVRRSRFAMLCKVIFHIKLSHSPFPDIDECVLGTYMCDVNAYCENTIGSYDCVCVDGYVKNGTFCMSKLTMMMGSPRFRKN